MPLILLEGTPGSGKTTTTRNLHDYLQQQGQASRAYPEFASDHPIGPVYNKETAAHIILNTRLATYPFHYWRNLSLQDGEYLLFEAKFLQMTGFFCMLAGGSEDEGLAIVQRILKELPLELRCQLVYFRQSNPRAHVEKTVAVREQTNPNLFPWILSLFAQFPWVKQRQLVGPESYYAAVSAWSEIQVRTVSQLAIECLELCDAERDWPAALKQIYNWIG